MSKATEGGSGGTLVLRGESGIGKTTLLRYATTRAVDAVRLECRGHGMGKRLAFGALSEPLRHLLSEEGSPLVALPRRHREVLESVLHARPVGQPDRFTVPAALSALLAGHLRERGVVVTVDDWNQVDAASRDALLFSFAQLRGGRLVVLIAATDPDPWGDPVAPGVDRWQSLRLRGITVAEGHELIERCTEVRPADTAAEAITRATGGNPLAMKEVASHLTHDQLVGKEVLPRHLTTGATPERVYGLRLASLSEEARMALLLVAIGHDDEFDLVAKALASLDVPLSAVVDELEEEALVRVEPGGVRLVHPLVGLAVSSAVPVGQRRAAHRALAAAMDDPRLVIRRAWHLAGSVVGTSEVVAHAMEEAARASASTSGYAGAAAAYEQAALLGEGGQRCAERLLAAGTHMRMAGDAGEATRLLRAAMRCDDSPPLVAAAEHALGLIELFAGRPGDAGRRLHAACALIAATDPVGASIALADASMAELLSGREKVAVRTAERAIAIGGDPGVVYVAEMVIGTALLNAGEIREALSRLDALPDPAGMPVDAYAVLGALLLVWTGRPAAALEQLVVLEQQLRWLDALGLLPLALYAEAYAHLAIGRVRIAGPLFLEAHELATATGNGFWRYLASGGLAMVEALKGDRAACERIAREADEHHERADLFYPRDARIARGLVHLAAGNAEEAVRYLHPSLSPTAPPDGLVLDWMNGPDLIEAYVRLGVPIPGPLVHALEDLSEDRTHAAFAASAWRSLALLAPERAGEHFKEALRLYEKAELPLHLARTQLLYGAHLRRHGSRSEAHGRLHEARAICDRLGARLWAERAEQEIQARRSGDPARGSAALVALTPHELRVAELVARGATNREAATALFVSRKTVEMHLSRIYRKLGIRSRSELVRIFPSHPDDGDQQD